MTTENDGNYRPSVDRSNEILFRPLSSEGRNKLPDAAFAYIKHGDDEVDGGATLPTVRMFPHHIESVESPTDSGSVSRALLKNAFSRLPQANLSISVKKEIYKHLSQHALEVDPPMNVSEPLFSDGPQPMALMFKDDGTHEWTDSGDTVAMSLQISDMDRKSLYEAMESDDQELGRPMSWVQVVGCGKRFINGNWIDISTDGDCDYETGSLSLVELVDSFKEDKEQGIMFFVDYGHAHSNKEGDYVSELSAGDIVELDAREDGLWANVRWTPRAARSIIDGEFNLTSIHFRWFGVDNLSDPPQSRGPHFINFALTNNPAWQGQKPIDVEATNTYAQSDAPNYRLATEEEVSNDTRCGTCKQFDPDEGGTTGYCNLYDFTCSAMNICDSWSEASDSDSEYGYGKKKKKKKPMWSDFSLDLGGGTIESFMSDVDLAVMKAGMGGMFGDVDPGSMPSFSVKEVTGSSIVVESETGVYVLTDWSRDEDGKIVLTNPRQAKKTYLAARGQHTSSGDNSEMNTTENIEIETEAVETDAVVQLRNTVQELSLERDELKSTIEKIQSSDGSEIETLRKENNEISERLASMELENRDARRDAARQRAKLSGVPERMMTRVLDAYDIGGEESMKEYIDDLDEIGALSPIGKRTGTGTSDVESVSSGTDKRAEAWRKIDLIRSEATEGGSSVTSREAMSLLRKQSPDLYDALGTYVRPVNGARS